MPKYNGICPPSREVDVYTHCPFDCVYCIGAEHRNRGEMEINQVEKLLAKPPSSVPVYASPWTDPYPPEEEWSKKTRGMLEWLSATDQPFFVITKGTLVERDKDLFLNRSNAFIAISLNTVDDSTAAIIEPNAPRPSRRMKVAENLIADASVRVVVRVDPIIPGLTDGMNLISTIQWLCKVKPFAVCFETLRLNSSIAARLKGVLPGDKFYNMMSSYEEPEEEPVHPELEWRYSLFKKAAISLDRAGIRASFCRASLPEPVTKWDCRGGFDS